MREPVRRMPRLYVLQVPNVGYNDAEAYHDRAMCSATCVECTTSRQPAWPFALRPPHGVGSSRSPSIGVPASGHIADSRPSRKLRGIWCAREDLRGDLIRAGQRRPVVVR